MKTYVASLGVLLILSAAARAQSTGFPQGALDLDSLRSQVMSRHFGPADGQNPRLGSTPPLMIGKPDLDEQIWSEWGVALGPVPALLYMHCPDLKPDAGLLIEKVRPGSPAEEAGLVAGQVLAGAEDEWFQAVQDLPRLIEPQTVIVLVAGRLCEVDIRPDRTPLSAGNRAAELRSAPASVSAFGAAADEDGSQAISMACANGVFDIDASYATAKGRQKIHLSGTRKQVEKSMADLPAAVQQSIQRRLEMVAPN